MAIPDWPDEVPYESLRAEWDVTPFRSHLETEMESGDVRVRRRTAARLPLMSWAQVMDDAQFAAFRTFVETTIYDGTSRFRMPVTLDGATFETRTVQFQAKSISWASFAPGLIRASAKLYIFPASVTS